MNRASFRTKSMSLNVSGKHNSKCKSMLCTEYSFSLSHASHVARVNNPYFKKKKKSSTESSFCGVNGFFLSFAWLWICFLFQLFIQLLCHCNDIHTTHPFPHSFECRNKNRSSTQFQNFKTKSRHKSSNVYHHFSLDVACDFFLIFSYFFLRFFLFGFIHSVRFWFGLVWFR